MSSDLSGNVSVDSLASLLQSIITKTQSSPVQPDSTLAQQLHVLQQQYTDLSNNIVMIQTKLNGNLDNSMITASILAINNLNNKYDEIMSQMKGLTMNNMNVSTIVSSSLSSVNELSTKNDNLILQVSALQNDLQTTKLTK